MIKQKPIFNLIDCVVKLILLMKLYGYDNLDRFLLVKSRDDSRWCDLFSMDIHSFVLCADLSALVFLLILFYSYFIN